MRNVTETAIRPAFTRMRLAVLLCVSVLIVAGCTSPGSDSGQVTGTVEEDGTLTGRVVLPTDTLLNLSCADAGVWPENCVLDDPENPFRFTGTPEFDVNDPDAETKFDLFEQDSEGPHRRERHVSICGPPRWRGFQSGENQYYTALALHELYTAAGDPDHPGSGIERRIGTVWDNFFGSVTVFECCGEFFPDPPGREDTAVCYPAQRAEVLERLVRAADTPDDAYPAGYEPLIPDDPDAINQRSGPDRAGNAGGHPRLGLTTIVAQGAAVIELCVVSGKPFSEDARLRPHLLQAELPGRRGSNLSCGLRAFLLVCGRPDGWCQPQRVQSAEEVPVELRRTGRGLATAAGRRALFHSWRRRRRVRWINWRPRAPTPCARGARTISTTCWTRRMRSA